MTVFGRDLSNFDADPIDFTGLGLVTHKATEGTTTVHDRYAARLTAARAAGVPVLGAYHVPRTPGSGGNGSLGAQLSFWLDYVDQQTPWWRTHPHFVLQIDLERWPYDNVSPAIGLEFAALLARSGVPGWKVTYASRGQYGNALTGIATPLWNADYRGSVAGSYPGDGWTTDGPLAAGWAPYSGQTPVLLQYTSTPHDLDAFRGSLAELLALTGGHVALKDEALPAGAPNAAQALSDLWNDVVKGRSGFVNADGTRDVHFVNRQLDDILAALKSPAPLAVDASAVAAALAADPAFHAAVVEDVKAALRAGTA